MLYATIFCERYSPVYVRLAFWTLSLAYLAALLSHGTPDSSPGTVLTAVVFGAILGFSLGGMLINRRTRKRS